jgi:hypothetical protein
MLREMIQENVPRYIAANTKTDKGHVIIDIVEKIRRDSPTGVGLVRQNPKTERWFFIGVEKAKDKVGHALRKASQGLEKRQTKGKGKRKRKMQKSSSSDSLTVASSTSPTTVESSPTKPTVSYDEGPRPYSNYHDEAVPRPYPHYPYPVYHLPYPGYYQTSYYYPEPVGSNDHHSALPYPHPPHPYPPHAYPPHAYPPHPVQRLVQHPCHQHPEYDDTKKDLYRPVSYDDH